MVKKVLLKSVKKRAKYESRKPAEAELGENGSWVNTDFVDLCA